MSTQRVTRTFRIRRYECDAYGHVNNTTYLRYLEELEHTAGLEASSEEGLLATIIDFRRPLHFGDEVTVEATPRSASVRSYTYRLASGESVATAEAVWRGHRAAEPLLLQVPEPPDPPRHVFTQERLVEWRDVDQHSRVSPATLSAFAEDCGVDLCSAFGWPLERCTQEGFAMLLRRHEILYGEPVGLGSSLELRTWASDVRRTTAVRHYLLASGGKQVARFRSQYVWVAIDTMHPIRIPPRFLEDFAPNFSDMR